LPASLQPFGASSLEPPDDSGKPLTANPLAVPSGVADEAVRACRDAIAAAAAPFGATSVRVSSAGSVQRSGPDRLSAPIDVSIDYARQGGVETRQSPVTCELNAAGAVIGLT
jgi:hypothetical protein